MMKSFHVLKNRLGTRELDAVTERAKSIVTVQTDDVEMHGYLEASRPREYVVVGCVSGRGRIWQRVSIDRRRVKDIKVMNAD